MEIEIVAFIINGSRKDDRPYRSTVVILCKNKKCSLCRVFDLKFIRIHLVQIIFKDLVVYGQYITDVHDRETEPRRPLFLSRCDQRLYSFRSIREAKDVG